MATLSHEDAALESLLEQVDQKLEAEGAPPRFRRRRSPMIRCPGLSPAGCGMLHGGLFGRLCPDCHTKATGGPPARRYCAHCRLWVLANHPCPHCGRDQAGEAESLAYPSRADLVFDQFAFDSAALPAAHAPRIEMLAAHIAASRTTAAPVVGVHLAGHTDSSGPAGYNQALGLRRARTVHTRLIAALNRSDPMIASRVRLTLGSAGESQPIAGNQTPAGRARNRRVEVFLSTAKPGLVCPFPPTQSRAFTLWLQRALNRILGRRLAETGRFDTQTHGALRSFQRQRGLPVTGTIGPATHRVLMALSGLPVPCQLQGCNNPLDARATRIINAADAQQNPGVGPDVRATQAVLNTLRTYYPNEAAKVSGVQYHAPLPGLETTSQGTGQMTTGLIRVGDDFLTHMTPRHFPRRVLQVGHEVFHINQWRAGMAGAARKAEREFLAFNWEVTTPELPGTGCMQHATRVALIDAALGNFNCLGASQQQQYAQQRANLLTLRVREQTASGLPPTSPPTACVLHH